MSVSISVTRALGRLTVPTALLVALTACSGEQQRDTNDGVRERLSTIEKRLGSAESRLEEFAKVTARLEALEQRIAALEARPPASSPPAKEPAAGTRSDGRDEPGARWSQPQGADVPPSRAPGSAPWPGQGDRR